MEKDKNYKLIIHFTSGKKLTLFNIQDFYDANDIKTLKNDIIKSIFEVVETVSTFNYVDVTYLIQTKNIEYIELLEQ